MAVTNFISRRAACPPYKRVHDLVSTAGDLPKESFNPAVLCCDRHAPHDIALRALEPNGEHRTYTYGQLQELSSRFANLLVKQGVRRGEVVAVLLPRTPELVVALLGAMRIGAIYQPLFTAFGPKAVAQRLQASGAKLVVTDGANRSKLPTSMLKRVISIDGLQNGDVPFNALEDECAVFDPVILECDDPMLILFTSGTTGDPKGVRVPCGAVHSFVGYMKYAVDLQPSDRYWNLGDPGWAYGLYYGVIGPMLLGCAFTFFSGPFTPEHACQVIEKLGIDNLAGAPTAFRMLISQGEDVAERLKCRLRVASSAGEALNVEVIRWFEDRLQCRVFDHYGQTEGGMIVANHHGLQHETYPGTAGLPLPGIHVDVLDETSQPVRSGEVGELCVDRFQSPYFWFAGYWDSSESETVVVGRYHRTGDLVKMLPQGAIAFVGRADDIITSSGYRIGPFDVESTLMEHPAVAEVAVVGKPDAERTELVKAFVVLRDGYASEPSLVADLQTLVKHRLAAHAFPREVQFVKELPKTPSGKIRRVELRQRELRSYD